jgi:hypothetical protein
MSMLRILSALAVGLVAMITSAQAAPVSAGPELAQASQSMSEVSQVQWRRGYYGGYGGYGGGWGYRRGPWIGLGVGAGIVAGAIIADRYYRPRPGYYYDDYAYDGPYYRPAGYGGDPRVLCAENFRSFEWRTGLYTTYGGERRLCPYLR